MKISVRILLGYFVIVGLASWFVLNSFADEVKPGVRQAMEDTLVDTANVLARLAADDLRAGRIADGTFARALRDLDALRIDARIWQVHKTRVDYRIHVTDAKGVVVFDSAGLDVGRDFSRWRDIYLTLRGRYGARSTWLRAGDSESSVMHIAAPIRADGRLIGVLSVAKPNAALAPFVARSRRNVIRAGLWLLGLSLIIGVLFAAWISGSLNKLVRYAERVSRGEKAAPPTLGHTELGALSVALAGMREKLEGKQYVERYVHALTHEMKSPLTAIRGAAELLGEDLPAPARARFAANVNKEAERLQTLVERMLALAAVESRQRLEDVTPVSLRALCAELAAAREATCADRGLRVEVVGVEGAEGGGPAAGGAEGGEVVVDGDRFLLAQAIGNLLDNAIAFSPAGGRVTVEVRRGDREATLTVADTGPGIADFAADRVFERFFSLPRPGTDRKSTGLGLPFVREVMALHHGEATLANRPGGGAVATLRMPLRRRSS